MTKKIAIQVNYVRFPNFERFRFYDYTFELPSDHELLRIEISGNRYIAHTSQGPITLRSCSKCKRLLTLDSFYKHCSPCKACHQIVAKRWTKKHPELAKAYAKKYQKKYRYLKKLQLAGVK